MALNIEIEIVPVEKTAEKAPDYRVYGPNGSELGAGWSSTTDQGTRYISIKLDDPSLSGPLYVPLFRVEGTNERSLLWQSPNAR